MDSKRHGITGLMEQLHLRSLLFNIETLLDNFHGVAAYLEYRNPVVTSDGY
jgi:hypothetical protein